MARMLVLTYCEYFSFVAWIFGMLAKACLPVLGNLHAYLPDHVRGGTRKGNIERLPRLAVNHDFETSNMQRCYENASNHYIHTSYEDDNFE